MDFKTLLLLSGMVGLVACSKAPVAYVEAAERMAEDVCHGIVAEKYDKDETYFNLTESAVSRESFYKFTCITERGSERRKIHFKDIPVKYFKIEGESND